MIVFSINNKISHILIELDEYIEGEKEIFTCRFDYSSLNKKILLYKLNYNKKLLNEFSIDIKNILNCHIKECCLRDITKQIKLSIKKVDEYTFSIIISKDSEKPQCTIYLEQKIDHFLLKSIYNDLVEFNSVF
ncbi:hypothetical protein [Bacillus stratosphericus]|uniref:hypothetical protein n=1 Tax=Bacillus stratosphericus TaxID=293386 RepID=UPI001CFA35F1|nr:hypothetical protein [Bacillus stratosphericus]